MDYLPLPLSRLRVPPGPPDLSRRHRPTLPVEVPSWQRRRARACSLSRPKTVWNPKSRFARTTVVGAGTLAGGFRKKRRIRARSGWRVIAEGDRDGVKMALGRLFGGEAACDAHENSRDVFVSLFVVVFGFNDNFWGK